MFSSRSLNPLHQPEHNFQVSIRVRIRQDNNNANNQFATKSRFKSQQQAMPVVDRLGSMLTLVLLLLLLLSINAPVNVRAATTTATSNTNSAHSESVRQQQQAVASNFNVNHLSPVYHQYQLSEYKRKFVKLDPSLNQLTRLAYPQQQQHPLARYNLNLTTATSSSSSSSSSSSFSEPNSSCKSCDTTDQVGGAAAAANKKQRGLFDKVCIGTSNKLSVTRNRTEHYLNLVERYSNCTYVIGNLEITWLNDDNTPDAPQLDMSFLESIREITGYLLIAKVNVEKISMPNLQIIRGRDLIATKRNCETMKCDDKEKDELAILLMYSEIKSLELPNLREILAGGVGSFDNKNLCYLRTVNWEEILNAPYKAIFRYNLYGPPECPACDKSCMGNCWAEGPEMCQKLSKTCAQCNQGRCFGTAPRECCHPFCAGGCTGPKQTDCLACKNFYDDGECIQECPPMQKYNPSKFSWEPNPRGKYAYGASCVKECPDYLLRDNGACVRTCPSNKRNSNGECLSCSGPGPKECPQGDVIHSGNMDNQLVNCSLIEGSMSILEISFAGITDLLNVESGKNPPCYSASSLFPLSIEHSSEGGGSAEANSSIPAGATSAAALDQSTMSTNDSSTAAAADQSKQNSDHAAGCKAIINSTGQLSVEFNSSTQCIKLDEPCPDGFYQEYIGPSGRPVCRRCHHRCQRCTGMGTHVSVCQCAAYVAGEQCEDFCPRDYFADERSRRCLRCSTECNGCSGPTEADCHTCRVYRVYLNGQLSPSPSPSPSSIIDSSVESNNIEPPQQNRPFNCTSQCPVDKPYRISDGNLPDLYCSDLPDINGDAALLASRGPNQTLVGLGTWLVLFCVIFSGFAICLWVHRLESEKDKTAKLAMQMHGGTEDVEPLHPSNVKPNLAPLRSIKETELRKGNELGSGFGGTVYQGLWYPEGREHKNPRPVAIKVLRDNGQSNMNKKFLDEAYIMASVNHPNLVQLLAVCMTPKHMMLVTPLMPLGCLLEHVKKHKNEISSKQLLEWSKQIAKGMAYLEEHRMVHRDLALRNVLLRTCGHAMISDFGLAKFLEIDQSEYHSLGGRLPVKWLAPECIRERRFTHRSDVWAFGVTLWELLTFGKKPFEEYNTWKDMLVAVENGARLEQPPYLTTEVYSVMLSCWFYKPEARPSFKQLTQDFVKFAQDPMRYVAIGAKGLDYGPSSPLLADSLASGGKLSRAMNTAFASSKKQQQRHNAATDLDSDADEYSVDSGEDASQASLSLAGDDLSPDSVQRHQLIASATSELTPSTHNRINETIRFDFNRRHHHHYQHQHQHQHQHHHQNRQSSSISGSSDTLKTPTTPLKRMHFATDQQLIEEVDYDDIGVFKSSNNKSRQLDGNNNFITVAPTDPWQRQLSTSTAEQPTDIYDYLLPSPCTEGDTHNFSQLCSPTTGGDCGFDQVDSSKQEQQQKQQQKQPPGGNMDADQAATASISGGGGGGQQSRCSGTLPMSPQALHQHHLSSSMVGINNYEYFIARASSQYMAANQHYADMDPSLAAAAAAAAAAASRQLQHSQQHLSTSNGNIPHSLV